MSSKRYQGPEAGSMSPEQARIYADIASTRTTGVKGPFKAWLGAPAIADQAQKLGRVVRYELEAITRRETEMVILMTAIRYKCRTEYNIHRAEALKVGLSEQAVDSLHHPFHRPALTSERELVVHDFAQCVLCDSANIPQDVYAASEHALGPQALVELTSLIGISTAGYILPVLLLR